MDVDSSGWPSRTFEFFSELGRRGELRVGDDVRALGENWDNLDEGLADRDVPWICNRIYKKVHLVAGPTLK